MGGVGEAGKGRVGREEHADTAGREDSVTMESEPFGAGSGRSEWRSVWSRVWRRLWRSSVILGDVFGEVE